MSQSIKKDLAGINEQLYELEKSNMKNTGQIEHLRTAVLAIEKENEQQKQIKSVSEVEKTYKDGYKKYLSGDYTGALKLFNQIKTRKDDFLDSVYYFQGESYLKLNSPQEALICFKMVYRYFPFGSKADFALYKIGLIFYDKKEYSRSSLAFRRLINEYHDSEVYKAAVVKIRAIQKLRRKK